MSAESQRAMEEFAAIHLFDLQRALGSRMKLHRADAVTIHFAGRDVLVCLARIPSTLGRGQVLFMKCPRCERKARVLRLVPAPEVLVCSRCVRRAFKARYTSQIRSKRSTARTAVRRGEGESHAQVHDPQ